MLALVSPSGSSVSRRSSGQFTSSVSGGVSGDARRQRWEQIFPRLHVRGLALSWLPPSCPSRSGLSLVGFSCPGCFLQTGGQSAWTGHSRLLRAGWPVRPRPLGFCFFPGPAGGGCYKRRLARMGELESAGGKALVSADPGLSPGTACGPRALLGVVVSPRAHSKTNL